MKALEGELHFYFATGEEARPQFIGDASLDEKRMVKNYDQVYDLKEGDVITILHSGFNPVSVQVSEKNWEFWMHLTALWCDKENPLRARFTPARKHKSWSEM